MKEWIDRRDPDVFRGIYRLRNFKTSLNQWTIEFRTSAADFQLNRVIGIIEFNNDADRARAWFAKTDNHDENFIGYKQTDDIASLNDLVDFMLSMSGDESMDVLYDNFWRLPIYRPS